MPVYIASIELVAIISRTLRGTTVESKQVAGTLKLLLDSPSEEICRKDALKITKSACRHACQQATTPLPPQTGVRVEPVLKSLVLYSEKGGGS